MISVEKQIKRTINVFSWQFVGCIVFDNDDKGGNNTLVESWLRKWYKRCKRHVLCEYAASGCLNNFQLNIIIFYLTLNNNNNTQSMKRTKK